MVTREAVLAKAGEWVGTLERTGNNDVVFADHYGITGQSWCFAFVNYVFEQVGAPLPGTFMYVPYGVAYARNNGQAIEVGQGDPLPGDIVFFSWDMATWPRSRPGTGDHVGIVESYGGGDVIRTIEGNIGSPQGVWRKVRSISGTVICFWRPPVFDDGTFGVAGQIQQEEDVTPEEHQLVVDTKAQTLYTQTLAQNLTNAVAQIQGMLQEVRNYAGGAHDQGVAANQRLVDLAATVGTVDDNVKASADAMRAKVDLMLSAMKGEAPPPEKVVDVEASLKQASPSQLIDALREVFAQPGPKPAVRPPDAA